MQKPYPGGLPHVVAHADWSAHPAKRWVAAAHLAGGQRYHAFAPCPVGELDGFLDRLVEIAGPGGTVFLGFDFPLGLPARYARRAGIDDFRAVLPALGRGRWRDFFRVAEHAGQIAPGRPFYPARPGRRGQVSKRHLVEGLGLTDDRDLMRACDHAAGARPAAAALFWTLGPQQVGKAAITGWRDLLIPALASGTDLAIWPFDGPLDRLLAEHRVVVAETYPAEVYGHLGLGFATHAGGRRGSKRAQADRAANAAALLAGARSLDIDFDSSMTAAVEAGFGRAPGGEDPFDATVGLLGMLNVVRGRRPAGEPGDPRLVAVEGWILGQRPN